MTPSSRPILPPRRQAPLPARDGVYASAALGRAHLVQPVLVLVCARHDLSLEQLRRRRRLPNLVAARWEAMWLLRETARLTLARIAELLGLKDFTSVVHGLTRIEQSMDADPAYAAELRGLRARLLGPVPPADTGAPR